ncbi:MULTISPECIES: collagen-like protein [Pseudomonas]|uniref:Collagen-like protein n=1 Tax=Pseudomonas juntendi TaxID=2666183 RepID=A0AAJ5UWQ1_9PSED|nr:MULTISPECIES: collagen-like protein [Pseudomonas]MDH1550628.1 collagen-like protein [Pseudomonas juntendi]QOH71189.1 collagen-like protein [Pseudomonas putida]WEA19473.1 collagen-like protein [Pseudomonas juntendi]
MRNLILLALLAAPFAHAESLEVAANSMLRLPSKSASVHLEHLRVADAATLMLPASLAQLKVDQLELGRDARIVVAPGEQLLLIDVRSARLGEGSEFSATGAAGSYQRPARPGRSLDLVLAELDAQQLVIDARGGAGAPGYAGLDGGNGQAGGCTWGQASRGANGDDGGNGHDGAAGGRIRLSLPQGFAQEHIVVRLDGGAPGKPGEPGKAGKGGASKGCLVYRTDAGANGRPGQPGQPGLAGAAGELILQRL